MLAAGYAAANPRDLNAGRLRAEFAELAQMMDDRSAPIGEAVDFVMPSPAGPLAARRYLPAGTSIRPGPALLYFHGGAWVFCGLDTHEGLCRALCHFGNLQVIAVAYRQAPEHKFPAPMDDATASLDWLIANTASLGIEPARFAIGGDSAGATLAIGACLAARDAGKPQPALQLLLCPKTDVVARTPSRAELAKGHFLEEATLAWAVCQLCPEGTDLRDPRLSPLGAPSLAGLPPAVIHTAEFDPLRDEGAAFAQRLLACGGEATLTCHPGMIHHFYGLTAAMPGARKILQGIGAGLGQRLSCG
jgi:acetyl esterase